MTLFSSIRKTALGALETVVNRYLRLDPAGLENMAALEGKVIEVHLRVLELRLFIRPGSRGVRITGETDREPDTTISGTPLALARTGLQRGERPGLFSDDVRISGDVETGRELKAALDALDIDWEEQLSHLVGDVVAHHIGNMARGARHWSGQASETLQRDLGEYLQEESRLVPHPDEVEEFMASVDRLRADADRLEQRVARIEARLGVPGPDDPGPGAGNDGPEDGG